MKFPYSMLRDFVDTKLDADAVGDMLTMAGFELEGIETVEGDAVLDIKVVSNRGDGLSVFGLAREVLAKDAESAPTELYERARLRFASSSGLPESAAPIRIDTEDCARYAALTLVDVKNGAAPDWIQQRLRQAGQRPISLLVDLTNYVMLELGQPLHAFDFDKLSGPAIVVRSARPGEKIKTLDGVDHELRTDQMMICDAERPIAAAGIMGGEATEVDATTQRVLLESAHFDCRSVRRTRKQLGLNTEASYRFERSVDPDGVVGALRRFHELLGEAGTATGLTDVYPLAVRRGAIEVDLARACQLLGMDIPEALAVGYLGRLGFEVSGERPMQVVPPSWRPDVVREEDVVEELGRIHGYEKIPELLPVGATIIGGPRGFEAWRDRVKESCLRAGFVQTISHSLKGKSPLDDPTLAPIGPRNPASPETTWLRNSLLSSLAENAVRNGGKDVRLFEMGRVFGATEEGPVEHVRLGLLAQGLEHKVDWVSPQPHAAGFFALKGVVESVAGDGGVVVEFGAGDDSRLHPTKQARIRSGATTVGVIGQIDPDAAAAADLPADTILAELDLERLYEAHGDGARLKPISRNPAVRRDIALLIDKSVPFAEIGNALDRAVGDALEDRWLFDVYEGKGIPEGKHSLAIALQLRKFGSNFTDEEANQVRAQAVAALAALGGTPR